MFEISIEEGLVLPAVKRGYVVAVLDARGRGSSEGEFTPFAQEARWEGGGPPWVR